MWLQSWDIDVPWKTNVHGIQETPRRERSDHLATDCRRAPRQAPGRAIRLRCRLQAWLGGTRQVLIFAVWLANINQLGDLFAGPSLPSLC